MEGVDSSRFRRGDGGDGSRDLDLISPPERDRDPGLPHFTEANTGEQIDAFLEFCRSRCPLNDIACWTVQSGEPWGLGERLMARGFQWGWMVYWMGLAMGRRWKPPRPKEWVTGEVAEEADWANDELGDDNLLVAPIKYEHPQRVWVFTATVGDRVMGRCILNLMEGPLGSEGDLRPGSGDYLKGRGIREALVHLACRTGTRVSFRGVELDP